jgi:hypothetical protein
MPAIVCDPYEFKFTSNNNNAYGPMVYMPSKNIRTIIDMLNPEKEVYVFFDYPDVLSSALYAGTFNSHMKHMILKGLEAMKANYKTTPVGLMPFTAKIDMASFAQGRFSRIYTGQSLEYRNIKLPIVSPEQLFDVIDTDSK